MTKAKKPKSKEFPAVDRKTLSDTLGRMTKDFTKQVSEVAEKAGVKLGVKVLIAECQPSTEGDNNGSF